MRKIKTVKQFLYEFFETHKEKLTKNYPGLKADILVQKYLSYKNLTCHLQQKDCFLYPNDSFFEKILTGIPFEYLLGEKFFYNHNFVVNSDVLIPRNETEILVEDAVNYIKKNYHNNFNFLEVGVGSGCIFLSILCELEKKLNVMATDISDKALIVSKTNLFRLQKLIAQDSKIEFKNADRLFGIDQKFDLIVSNPPYIKQVQGYEGVHWQVNSFEPHLALYLADNNYEAWFLEFFSLASNALNPHGVFMMEGHEDTLENLAKLASSMFSSIELKKDYTDRYRFLHLTK